MADGSVLVLSEGKNRAEDTRGATAGGSDDGGGKGRWNGEQTIKKYKGVGG